MLVLFNITRDSDYADIFDSADNTVERVSKIDIATLVKRGIEILYVEIVDGFIDIPGRVIKRQSKIKVNNKDGVTILVSRYVKHFATHKSTLIFYNGELIQNITLPDTQFRYSTGTDVWLNFVGAEDRFLYIDCKEKKPLKDRRIFDIGGGNISLAESGICNNFEQKKENGTDIITCTLRINNQNNPLVDIFGKRYGLNGEQEAKNVYM